MQEKASNKMMTKEEAKTKEFFYPDYGITITATSQEEADVKLSEIINKK